MAQCEVCGNDYDKAFEVVRGDETHTFDSFECAIHALAPACQHCGCKVIGHGVEEDGRVFCCPHCARAATGDSNDAADEDDDEDEDEEEDEDQDEDDDEEDDEEDEDDGDGDEDERPSMDKLDEIAKEAREARQRADEELAGPTEKIAEDDSGDEDSDGDGDSDGDSDEDDGEEGSS